MPAWCIFHRVMGGLPRSVRGVRGAIRVVLGILAVIAVASPAGAQPKPAPVPVRVGVYENKPKIFVDDQGRASGIFIDVLDAVARDEGWALTYTPCDWPECLKLLAQGRIDLMPDVAYSRERDGEYQFNRVPVLESWSQLYAASGHSLHALADLDGKRVAVLRDSIQQTYFEQMVRGFGYDVQTVSTQSLDEAFRLVADGEADAAMANHFFGEHEHRWYGLERTPIVFQVAQLHFATAKGHDPELLQAIDRYLGTWRTQAGSPYYRSMARWTARAPEPVVPRYALWVFGIVASLLVVTSVLVLMLRREVLARTRRLADANEHLTRAQRALLERQALLTATQRLSKVGGWQWNVKQQSMTWTEETYRIHDLSAEEESSASSSAELLEASFARYEPEDQAIVRAAFERCAEFGEPYDLELAFTSATGRRLWVRTTAEAVRGARGEVACVIGNIMDVTDAKRAEAERLKFEEQRRISQRMEAIGQLAGGVAHDFNNVIMVIIAYAEFALRTLEESDRAHADLTRILEAAARATALTNQLLAFSRERVMQPEVLSLNDVVTNLESMLRVLVEEDIELRIELSEERPTVLADAGQLEQIVVNLATNARDAMPRGGTLTIKLGVEERGGESPGRFAVLTVADTGMGMDAATRSRVFEPFFTTKEKGKGTGLGLATIYGIVAQCSGHIELDSEPGKGTTFTIALPHVDAEPTALRRAARAQVEKGNETVLVVEDEEVVRDATAQLLRAAGYTVVEASSGDEALRLCERGDVAVQLLLTDVAMPRMNGKQLAERMAQVCPQTKVLFMSGHIGDAAGDGGLAAGSLFIAKPFTIEELTRKVREALV